MIVEADGIGKPELRLVIPARNEESRIAYTIERFCSHFGSRATIVVVANGCVDTTVEIVTNLCTRFPNLRLISIPGAVGKGGAVRLGLSNGIEPYAGYADADGSAGPLEIDKLLTACREASVDGAIGSRWLPDSEITLAQSPLRRFASRVFNYCVRILFGLPFHDTQCGAKVFRRAAVESVAPELTLANFAFDIDLLFALRRAGFSLIEVPIVWSDSPLGSKVRLAKASTSMLAAIVNLRARHGCFRFFPYLDLFARSAVIPSKQRLSILCLSRYNRDDENPQSGLRQVVADLEAQGHSVRWARSHSLTEIFAEILWYVKRGHGEIDAIIADQSPFDWFFAISLKPKIRLVTENPSCLHFPPEAFDSVGVIKGLMDLLPYEFRFVKRQGVWDIVNRADTVVPADPIIQ